MNILQEILEIINAKNRKSREHKLNCEEMPKLFREDEIT